MRLADLDMQQDLATDIHRLAEDRFNQFATSISTLVLRCRVDGHQTWASPQWLTFTGLSAEASHGLGWLNAVHPDDQSETMAEWEFAETSGVYVVQNRVWSHAEGRFRWHLSRGKFFDAADGGTAVWVLSMTDIHDLVERRIRQDVLISELHHRARNLLAVTWAIASKTIRRCGSLEKFKEEFRQRIGALARVQELRCSNQNLDVGLQELVSAQLKAHAAVDVGSSKVAIEGPPVALSPMSAQTLGLALHELTTNAVKYGALSQAGGSLLVTWEVRAPGDPTVRISWKETGVEVPPDAFRRSGYGTELIKRALPFDLGAKTELWFEPDGLRCTIEVPRERLAVVGRDL